jgi:SAM-dependent methyltransferase
VPTSYDEVAYPCTPQAQTHPDVLATLATLYGLTPPPVERCSVLEVGCNDGSNLIPMAANEPASHFVGIDLAQTAIETARTWSSRLGLANTEFVQADVADWNPDGRLFDYILIHGVYSWVPAAVREAILTRCRESLSPNGVAYISYNALPGCYFRQYVRDVLRFHTRAITEPRQRIAAAREIASKMVAWLGDTQPQPAIRKEFELLLTVHESVLLHDDLADCNTPFYLSEFVAAAEHHGLQYLCDARFSRDAVHDLDVDGPDWLAGRQYGDFVTCRKFRSSLLCHGAAAVDRAIPPERVAKLLASSPAEPEPEPGDGTQKFRLSDEKSLSTNHPVAKRILTELSGRWPGWTPVPELPLDGMEHEAAAALLLRLYEARALDLRLRPPHLVSTVSKRPVASPLARYQLADGLETVTNQRHVSVTLTDALSRQFLMLLDGSRDRAALLRDLTERFDPEKTDTGDSPLAWHANGPANRLELAQLLDQGLDGNLAGMARLCLLVG